MHIKNVLVPMDFSPPARLALDHAIAFARKFRARLTILHVVEAGTALTYSLQPEAEKFEKEHIEQARRMLPAMVSPEDQDDLDLHVIVKTGDIADEILNTVHQQNTGLIVMGTHGRGLLRRLLIGSVTEAVLRKVDIPLVTISHAARYPAFDNILLATDLTEVSSEGSNFAMQLAQQTHAHLVALHAVPLSIYASPETGVYVVDALLENARARLDELKTQAAQENIKIETVLAQANPADAILKAAEDTSAELIVITIARKGTLERTLLGTVAERVIRKAHVPVLSVPAGAMARLKTLEEMPAA